MPIVWMVGNGGSWKLPLACGLIAILIGAFLYLFAEKVLLMIIYLFGFIAIAIAFILFARAWGASRSGSGSSLFPLVFGIVALIIGLVSFVNPAIIGAFFAVLVSIILILIGLGLVFSLLLSGTSLPLRALGILGGIFLVVIGVSTLLYTAVTAQFIVELVGILLLVAGVISIIGALMLRYRPRSMFVDSIDQCSK
jgi:uncharacterized membrane protein HdeD (DUF308 family)